MRAPPPLFLLLPRVSYLPLCFDAARRHFLTSIPERVDDLWFDFEGVPLRWTLPVGVLFDMCLASKNARGTLPWHLTLHTQGFPSAALLRCPGEETLRLEYVNALKEGLFVRYESAKYAMGLNRAQHADLWDAVKAGAREAHARVLGEALAHGGAPERPAAYGVRVYAAGFIGQEAAAERARAQTPAVVSARGDEEGARTVGELVATRLGVPGPVEVVCHGAAVPPDTPLAWAARNLSHADLCLHLVVRPIEEDC